MLIESSIVNEIFGDCLYKRNELAEEEIIKEGMLIDGVNMRVYLNPEKVSKHKKEINQMINNLCDELDEGVSFTFLGVNKEGKVWTSLHRDMQEILLLGLAINRFDYCIENKKLWSILPGGLPYIIRKKA